MAGFWVGGGGLILAAIGVWFAFHQMKRRLQAEVKADDAISKMEHAAKAADIIVNDRPIDVDERLSKGNF